MKITRTFEDDINIGQMIEELQKEHGTVYWDFIEGNMYIYKACGRRDFNEIMDSNNPEADKEEEFIIRTLLYPEPTEHFIENMKAGVFGRLLDIIMETSHLREEDIIVRVQITNAYRAEMFDMQNQVTCIIHEAFPEFTIEDIENWGIEKTSKYLTRSEWILQNLRGLPINEELAEAAMAGDVNKWNKIKEDIQKEAMEKEKRITPETKKVALTPEKLADLKAKFPEIDWENDSVNQMGEAAFNDNVRVNPATETLGYK